MKDFLEQVGVALLKFADAYSVKTAALMKNAEVNGQATKYNMDRDVEDRAKRAGMQGSSSLPSAGAHLAPKPKLAEVPAPVAEPREELGDPVAATPATGLTRDELLDRLDALGIEVPARTRTSTLITMLEKALAVAQDAPVEKPSAPPAKKGGVTEERTREYLKLYVQKHSMEEVGTLIHATTKCGDFATVIAQSNAADLFGDLVEACINAGVTVPTEGA